jgi:hypothetical protein
VSSQRPDANGLLVKDQANEMTVPEDQSLEREGLMCVMWTCRMLRSCQGFVSWFLTFCDFTAVYCSAEVESGGMCKEMRHRSECGVD